MRVLALGFASPLHGEHYYRETYGWQKTCLSTMTDTTVIEEPLTSLRDAPDPRGYDMVVVSLLTGGTSRLAKKYLAGYRGIAVLLCHGKHNSAASCLSAKTWLEEHGVKVRIVYGDNSPELCTRLATVYRGVEAAVALRSLRVLEINGSGELSEAAKTFMEKTGAVVEAVSYKVLREYAEKTSSDELEEAFEEVSRMIDTSGVDRDKLIEALRVYAAMKRLVVEKGYNAVAIDCFPYVVEYRVTPCIAVAMLNAEGIPTACEDDFHSLAMLHASLALTGEPGWIANPSGYTREGLLRFAHCTIAPRLGTGCFLLPHFESGYGYAVACRMKHSRMVAARLRSDYSEVTVYRAKIVSSGFMEPGYCRSQADADMGPINDRFYQVAVGNHHVFMPYKPGLLEALEVMGWALGWRVTVMN